MDDILIFLDFMKIKYKKLNIECNADVYFLTFPHDYGKTFELFTHYIKSNFEYELISDVYGFNNNACMTLGLETIQFMDEYQTIDLLIDELNLD